MGPQASAKTLSELADDLEHDMIDELNTLASQAMLYKLADGERQLDSSDAALQANPGKYLIMRHDPRLPRMPEKPTLIDFFKLRFATASNHLLQSATHALKAGLPEKTILACLLHDVAVVGFIRGDHGYWGAQLIEPYVDEEVSWAIRMHQALRFFPDDSVGYAYPQRYLELFGPHYQPEPYVVAEYEKARSHKYYMTARMICVNDIYSFDPSAKVSLDDFTDIIGRNFRQPKEGLGFDGSPVAHMWRTINWPTRAL